MIRAARLTARSRAAPATQRAISTNNRAQNAGTHDRLMIGSWTRRQLPYSRTARVSHTGLRLEWLHHCGESKSSLSDGSAAPESAVARA
jgi:hypothetical protein